MKDKRIFDNYKKQLYCINIYKRYRVGLKAHLNNIDLSDRINLENDLYDNLDKQLCRKLLTKKKL